MSNLTDSAVRSAIEATQGNLLFAAQTLRVTRQELVEYGGTRPWVNGLVVDFRDRLLDDARLHLDVAVGEQLPWAIKATLQTLGRDRGYGVVEELLEPCPAPPPPEPTPNLDLLDDAQRARLQEILDIITVKRDGAAMGAENGDRAENGDGLLFRPQEAPALSPEDVGAKKVPVPLFSSAALDETEVHAVLQRYQGHLAFAAEKLGLTRSQLCAYIGATPSLQQLLASLDESLVDMAEWGLRLAVSNKKPWAICFTLRTRGRKMGHGKLPPRPGKGPWPAPQPRFDLRRLTDEQSAELRELLSGVYRTGEGSSPAGAAGVHPVDQP